MALGYRWIFIFLRINNFFDHHLGKITRGSTGTFILLLMQTLEKFPEVYNYPQRLNESNAKQFYLNSRKVINQLKNVCLIIFALIQFETISIALDWSSGFGKLFLPIIIIGTVIPIVIGIIRQRKIK